LAASGLVTLAKAALASFHDCARIARLCSESSSLEIEFAETLPCAARVEFPNAKIKLPASGTSPRFPSPN